MNKDERKEVRKIALEKPERKYRKQQLHFKRSPWWITVIVIIVMVVGLSLSL